MKSIDAKDCSPSCCPMCKSQEVEWGDIEYSDDTMTQEFDCQDCEASGVLVFKIKFDGFDVYEEGNGSNEDDEDA